jgi:hypothetical protein
MVKRYTLAPIFCSVAIIVSWTLVMTFSSFVSNPLPIASSQVGTSQQQPNINATSLYDTGKMILPSNVKHLVQMKDIMDQVKKTNPGLFLSLLFHKML